MISFLQLGWDGRVLMTECHNSTQCIYTYVCIIKLYENVKNNSTKVNRFFSDWNGGELPIN